MKTVCLPGSAAVIPALGLGTWRLGEAAEARSVEVAAIRRAFELGYRLIDTAEMYGEGGAEEIVGQALAEAMAAGEVRREEVFVVSKIYPHHASASGVAQACDRSRRRLRLDTIDLYLLHWRGHHPLAATVGGFEALLDRGRIAHWGVSNFDVGDMEELWRVPAGARCAANQVYYSASRRGIEFDLLPWQRVHGMPTMAYCPIDQGTLAADRGIARIAQARGMTAAQIALAWVLRHPDVVAIPKSAREDHMRENLGAATLELTAAELEAIDHLFPAPRRKQPLAMT